jgi:hypothetical protein
METNLLGQTFDGKRAVGVDFLVAGLVRVTRGIDQRLGGIEFRHDAVDGFSLHTRNLAITNLDTTGVERPNPEIDLAVAITL